jgi:3-hydroxyisobutyrate dehydrogenase-like beta-hydroxyacid dehydrogenase
MSTSHDLNALPPARLSVGVAGLGVMGSAIAWRFLAARSVNVPLPITTAVSELHRRLQAAGYGGADNAALMLYYTGRGEP